MVALLRLLFVVPLAYVAAVLAAGLTIAVAAVGAPGDAPITFAVVFTVHLFYIGAAAFVPAAIAITLAEIFAIRSVFYYLAVGGALGLAAQQLVFFVGQTELYETRPVIYVAAGFVGGAVYWIIAGLHAGLGMPTAAPRR